MSAFLGYHWCFETGVTRNVGEFYHGHHVIWEKSWPVLGTLSPYRKNLRMNSNRDSRTILSVFERTAPGWASCKPWPLPGGGEKETKPCDVSQPQAARTATGESGSSWYQRRACLGSGQHPKHRLPPPKKISLHISVGRDCTRKWEFWKEKYRIPLKGELF